MLGRIHGPEHESGPSPDVVLAIWQRRKALAAVVFIAAFAGAVTLTLSLPDLYRATATVLVERHEISEAFVRPSVTGELETRIQTIRQRVESRERLADLVTRMGLYPELRDAVPLDAIVERMRKDIQLQLRGVEQATGRTATIAFSLGYIGRDPERVAAVTNMLATFYAEENTKARERQASQTARFLERQLAQVKQELDAQELRASDFALQYTDELPEQLQANLAALERLNTQLRLNGEYQIRAMDRRDRIENDLAELRAAGPALSPPTSPAAQLLKLQHELTDLRRRFSDQYPDVVRLKEDIAALEQQVAQSETKSETNGSSGRTGPRDLEARLRKALQDIDREVAGLKQEEGTLRQSIAMFDARVASAPKRQHERQQLSRGYEMTKEHYQTLLKRYEDAELAANLEQGQRVEQFRILDSAVVPTHPAAPNRLWLAMMGLIASLALAVGAVVAAERFDTTFHTADDVRAFLGVPPLATIRRIRARADVRRHRIRLALMVLAVAIGLAIIVGGAHHFGSGNEQIVRLTARGAR
jgi:polysaccharide chain length determinant protein (PEP-CTERM system associated)